MKYPGKDGKDNYYDYEPTDSSDEDSDYNKEVQEDFYDSKELKRIQIDRETYSRSYYKITILNTVYKDIQDCITICIGDMIKPRGDLFY